MRSTDDAYFVAFSILILHTDVFNKNNKHKMQKSDYVRNSQEQSGIAAEILEYFYDNIAYTPFIHVEDDMHPVEDKVAAEKSAQRRSSKMPNTPSLKKNSSGPVDPYALILEGKLDILRPTLSEVLLTDDPFGYCGPRGFLKINEIHRSFFRLGVIQILSARSRPDAFSNQATITNPAVAQVGVVDLKVCKVGLLWRKDPKKKKTRSPWQEWGAVLTSSQLYMFRNSSWVKSLIHQHDSHIKAGKSETAVVFKPPLEHFKPDFLVPTDDVVALTDSQYKKHKNAFVLARRNAYQEVLLADNESDLHEWLGKINYAATFRTAGVRMKTFSQESSKPAASAQAPSGQNDVSESAVQTTVTSDTLAKQVQVARRQIVIQKLKEADAKIAYFDKVLDGQLRTARHLAVLAPIQSRTRGDVISAAEQLSSSTRWTRIEKWRLRCHRDILNMDLDDDASLASVRSSVTNAPQKREPGWQSKSPFSRFNSKSAGVGASSSRSRPSTQPTAAKLFSMDEIFRSPSKAKPAVHKAKGSWEIPPLNFDIRRSNSLPRENENLSHQTTAKSEPSRRGVEDEIRSPGSQLDQARAEAPTLRNQEETDDSTEEGLLATGPSSPALSVQENRSEAASEDEHDRPREPKDGEGLTKVRHSLQKKLQNAHAPSHSRSKRGREVAIPIGNSENGAAKSNERLARKQESFTVHGKKASVIKFGSEWQNITQDDRVKASKILSKNDQGSETTRFGADAAGPEKAHSTSVSSDSSFEDDLRITTYSDRPPSFQTALETTSPSDNLTVPAN